jgi:hypothetical protein
MDVRLRELIDPVKVSNLPDVLSAGGANRPLKAWTEETRLEPLEGAALNLIVPLGPLREPIWPLESDSSPLTSQPFSPSHSVGPP